MAVAGATTPAIRAERPPARGSSNQPTSPELEGAAALYDTGDYINASLILGKVIGGTAPVAHKQRAEYDLAKVLVRMGLGAAALSHFEQIARQGAAHRYHTATLPWLAVLLSELPADSELSDLLRYYDPAIVDDPAVAKARDPLLFLFGRRAYRSGALATAAELLARVEPDHELYPAARLLEGAAHVRRGDAASATRAFRSVHDAARDHPKRYRDARRLARLATLQMARVAYGAGELHGALELSDGLPTWTDEWVQGLLEASWAHLLAGERRSKALGNIRSLETSYFDDGHFPEASVLEALIYYGRCQYDRSLRAAQRAQRRMRASRRELSRLLALGDNLDLLAETRGFAVEKDVSDRARPAIGHMHGNRPAGRSAQNAVAHALDDGAFIRAVAWVDDVAEQIRAAQALDPAWRTTDVGIDVEERLAIQSAFAQVEAGRIARDRLSRLAGELRRLSQEASRIEIEALERKADEARARALRPAAPKPNRPEVVRTDDEHYVWKDIDGRIWRDEVGSVYAPVRDVCPDP